jgi:TonB family protein
MTNAVLHRLGLNMSSPFSTNRTTLRTAYQYTADKLRKVPLISAGLASLFVHAAIFAGANMSAVLVSSLSLSKTSSLDNLQKQGTFTLTYIAPHTIATTVPKSTPDGIQKLKTAEANAYEHPQISAPSNVSANSQNLLEKKPALQATDSLPPAPDFAMASSLDTPPKLLNEVIIDYPEAGKLQVGIVVLRLLIDQTGKIDNIAVVSESPPHVFDLAATSAFKNARYSPGKLLGIAVKSQVTLEIEFTPINRGNAVSGRGY